MKCFLSTIFTLLLISLFSGCTTSSNTVTLDKLPPWVKVNTPYVSSAQVRAGVAARFPTAQITWSDDDFTVVGYDWLQSYLTWEWKAAKVMGVDYVQNSFDCDKFALGFYFFATLSDSQSGVKASPLIARIVVDQATTAMNVPGTPGARHELIAVYTDKGSYVVEPQPDAGAFRVTPLEKYPNKILSITLGDYNPPGY